MHRCMRDHATWLTAGAEKMRTAGRRWREGGACCLLACAALSILRFTHEPQHGNAYYMSNRGSGDKGQVRQLKLSRPAPGRAGCPSPVTYGNLDCHLEQLGRLDPYSFKQQTWPLHHVKCPNISQALMRPSVRMRLTMIRPRDPMDLAKSASRSTSTNRVLCLLVTTSRHHGEALGLLQQVWGHRCDGFLAFSNVTDPHLSAVAVPTPGGDSYYNLPSKVRSMFKYVWQQHRNEFDWFLKVDDDSYLIWDNLLAFLLHQEVQAKRAEGKGMYIGNNIPSLGDPYKAPGVEVQWFNEGGPGYLLDSVALGKLVGVMDTPEGLPTSKETFNGTGIPFEDQYVAVCLTMAGVEPLETHNRQSRRRVRSRFLPVGPFGYAGDMEGCCSPDVISIHKARGRAMLHLHTFIHKCRQWVFSRALAEMQQRQLGSGNSTKILGAVAAKLRSNSSKRRRIKNEREAPMAQNQHAGGQRQAEVLARPGEAVEGSILSDASVQGGEEQTLRGPTGAG